jgi:hypothetical protein
MSDLGITIWDDNRSWAKKAWSGRSPPMGGNQLQNGSDEGQTPLCSSWGDAFVDPSARCETSVNYYGDWHAPDYLSATIAYKVLGGTWTQNGVQMPPRALDKRRGFDIRLRLH